MAGNVNNDQVYQKELKSSHQLPKTNATTIGS